MNRSRVGGAKKRPTKTSNNKRKIAKKSNKKLTTTTTTTTTKRQFGGVALPGDNGLTHAPLSTSSLPPSPQQQMSSDAFFDRPTIHSEPNQPAQFGIPGHTLRVKKLYRKLLRDHWNWYGLNNDAWITRAAQLRDEFEKYRHITDVGEIETVIKEAEVYLFLTEDPNPYRPLMHPNGGVFGRNQPMPRGALTPPPSSWDCTRDYHEEERVVRYFHAAKDDVDYAPTESKYAELKIKRGEYWHDPANPATFDIVVADYCRLNGIKYEPNSDEILQAVWGAYPPEPKKQFNANDYHWTRPNTSQV